MGDNELGAFLRARREAVTPAAAGLPDGGRRRTPGLRRAELATLSGVSVEYLTRLEQGRDRRPSTEILAALADALGLDTGARVHLHRLVKAVSGGVCQGFTPPAQQVRPTVRALLDRLGPAPAAVVNSVGELLAWNEGFGRLAGDTGLLDGRPPSLPRFVLTSAAAREVFPDWEAVADRWAAELRAAAALGDPYARLLADEFALVAGARFARSAELPARSGLERWVPPWSGELRLAYESLEVPGGDEQRLLVYLAADRASEEALAQAADRASEQALTAAALGPGR
ncbi:helix-turn-helix transcriptional regulator [Nonomuraea longicatena]|uniref:Helix-turn-helix transcriptional regulator n=1 Tax=Nonomuraea longicatena TaxID=83682 RepID=A0ABP4A514_9ACTN